MSKYGTKYDKYYVALCTPLKEDGFEVDYDAFRVFVKNYVANEEFNKIGGLIVLPEAGEIFTMSREEKDQLITIALEEAKGKVPVFAGALGIHTRAQVQDAVRAKELGIDGIFVMPPTGAMDITIGWDKFKFPEVYSNVAKAINDAVDLPLIAHGSGPFDPVYGASFSTEMILDVKEKAPNLVAWKMMHPNSAIIDVGNALREYEKKTGDHIGVFAAAGYSHYDMMMYDLCDGCVSCFWNYAQEPNTKLVQMYHAKDYAGMKELWLDGGLYNLHKIVGNTHRLHTTFKAATWLRGMIPNPYVRTPMIQVTKEEVKEIYAALKAANLSVITEEQVQQVVNRLPR